MLFRTILAAAIGIHDHTVRFITVEDGHAQGIANKEAVITADIDSHPTDASTDQYQWPGITSLHRRYLGYLGNPLLIRALGTEILLQ